MRMDFSLPNQMDADQIAALQKNLGAEIQSLETRIKLTQEEITALQGREDSAQHKSTIANLKRRIADSTKEIEAIRAYLAQIVPATEPAPVAPAKEA
jgi:peptidoglycan hydrolase CwlO-like protein